MNRMRGLSVAKKISVYLCLSVVKKKKLPLIVLSLMAGALCHSAENLEMKVRAAYKAADEKLMVAILLINNTEESIVVLTKPDSDSDPDPDLDVDWMMSLGSVRL